MLSRIHDVPVDLRTNNEAELEDDTFTIVRNKRGTCTYENARAQITNLVLLDLAAADILGSPRGLPDAPGPLLCRKYSLLCTLY